MLLVVECDPDRSSIKLFHICPSYVAVFTTFGGESQFFSISPSTRQLSLRKMPGRAVLDKDTPRHSDVLFGLCMLYNRFIIRRSCTSTLSNHTVNLERRKKLARFHLILSLDDPVRRCVQLLVSLHAFRQTPGKVRFTRLTKSRAEKMRCNICSLRSRIRARR
jgi:hypothetical protein